MRRVKPLDERRQPGHDRFGTGQPDDAGLIARRVRDVPLQVLDRGFDTFRIWLQLFAERREAIARRMSCHERTSEIALQLAQTSMNGRLAEPQRLSGRDGAAMARD